MFGIYIHKEIMIIKVTGSLRADTRTVYLIKRYFIVFFVTKNKAVWSDLDLENRVEIGTNSIKRAGRSVFVNTDDRSEVIRRCIPKRGVKMAVIRTQESFFRGLLNPLTTEFFPPRQHIFMHSAHTTFVGTPLPQHSLLSGQTWWGPHTWRDPSGNTVNDIHDPPQGQQSEVKGGCQPDFRPAFP